MGGLKGSGDGEGKLKVTLTIRHLNGEKEIIKTDSSPVEFDTQLKDAHETGVLKFLCVDGEKHNLVMRNIVRLSSSTTVVKVKKEKKSGKKAKETKE